MEREEERDFIRVQLFDGTNYPAWKYRILVALEEHDLLECVEQEIVDCADVVVDPNDEPDVKHRKERNLAVLQKKYRKCKSLLVSRISDAQIEHIQGLPTAKAIWDSLAAVYDRKSVAKRMHLSRQLKELTYSGGDLQQHFLRYESLVRQLRGVGAVMDNVDVVCGMLLSLDTHPSFSTVVTTLETLPPETLTMEFAKCRLLDEEIKRKSVDSSGSASTDSSSAAFGGSVRPYTGAKKKIRCYSCQGLGHRASECPERRAKENRDSSVKSTAHMSEGSGGGVCFGALTNRSSRVVWYVDSGASEHIVNDRNLFVELKPLEKPMDIAVVKNGESISAKFYGTVIVSSFVGEVSIECRVLNVLYVPEARCNLFSVRKVESAGMVVIFENGTVKIVRGSEVVAFGKRKNLLYELEFYQKSAQGYSLYMCGGIKRCDELWHRRFGHLSQKNLEVLAQHNMVIGLENVSHGKVGENVICEACIQAKQTRKPFKKNTVQRSQRVLQLVHTDVCGPISPVSHNGMRYFVSFIDDFSRFVKVFLMKSKDEVLQCFDEYVQEAEAYFGTRVSRVRCDNGGEYCGQFKNFCRAKGIRVEFTAPYTPEQNGVSERMNRTLVEKVRSMLFDSGVDKVFWGEAVQTAAFLTNRSPASALDRNMVTPFELWNGMKPDVSGMVVFGSTAYCHIPKELRKKIDVKSWKGIHLGYHVNGYRIYDPMKKQVRVVRDVVFDETLPAVKREELINGSNSVVIPEKLEMLDLKIVDREPEPYAEDLEESEAKSDLSDRQFMSCDEVVDEEEEVEEEEEIDLQKQEETVSHRARKAPVWHKDYDMDFAGFALNALGFVDNVPETLMEARKREDWESWEKAVNEEMDSLARNHTWTLTKLPEGRKPISCKWIFKVKPGPDGLKRYKARLVARGFSQRYGFDFTETYAPVARLDTLRTVLAVANQKELVVHQLDVKTAFLNGHLDEEIFMAQPEGFQQGQNVVCRLNRSLYGLKQASRAWNERLHKFLLSLGFRRSENDACLYAKEGSVWIVVYVDDLLVVSSDLEKVQQTKNRLASEFEMSDLGAVKVFLGMHIARDVHLKRLCISQRTYLESLLQRFGMQDCKPVTTPMECHLKLKRGDEENRTNKPYRELIGCLMYVTLTSRPDLSAAVNYMSQFQTCPTEEHWVHTKRILRYIKGSLNLALVFQGGEQAIPIEAYTDADWANDMNDRRSVSGYAFKVYGSTVAWLTRKQQAVSLSSTEAEYVALCTAACEGIWLVRLLTDLGVNINGPLVYHEDNQSCMRVAEEPRDSRRMKHVDVKYNFIRDLIHDGKIKIEYVPSAKQQADIFTKGLPSTLFRQLRCDLGLQE